MSDSETLSHTKWGLDQGIGHLAYMNLQNNERLTCSKGCNA